MRTASSPCSTLAPTTLFFSDRPDRVTGHISSEEFVDSWDKGPDNFASNPPNAVLSIFHPDRVSDVVVELTEPALEGHQLTYTVVILDGEMPAEGGPSALFIDVIGRPLSPVSVAGMHRRDRRRIAVIAQVIGEHDRPELAPSGANKRVRNH